MDSSKLGFLLVSIKTIPFTKLLPIGVQFCLECSIRLQPLAAQCFQVNTHDAFELQ